MLDRLTEVFCEVDDFCQAFEAHWQAYLLGIGAAPRGPKPGLSVSEIITLLLVLHMIVFSLPMSRGFSRRNDANAALGGTGFPACHLLFKRPARKPVPQKSFNGRPPCRQSAGADLRRS
jgi:hypothetical protein